jgi:hypothetical protein
MFKFHPKATLNVVRNALNEGLEASLPVYFLDEDEHR